MSLIPNTLSLLRIVLLIPAGYYLAQPGEPASLYCLGIVVLAGITDGLDGYLARRLQSVSRLGVALDPVADKIFVGGLVVLLMFHRQFPLWLAAAIIGRDLLIMAAGLIVMRKRDLSLPSNITGKYTFSSLFLLLVAYVLDFPFGITLLTWISVGFLILSTVNYGRLLLIITKGEPLPVFQDRPLFVWSRRIFAAAVFVLFVTVLIIERF